MQSTCGANGRVARNGSSVPRSQHRPSRECRAHHCSFTLTRHAPPTVPLPTPHSPPAGCSCTYSGLDVVAVYEAGTSHSQALCRRRSACSCAACLHLSGLDRPRGPWARTSLRQREMHEREMAEATKIGQDAAKATITFIENNTTRGSSPAMRKADEAEKEYTHVAVKTATAGGAASVEAGGRGDKRKAREAPLTAGVAPNWPSSQGRPRTAGLMWPSKPPSKALAAIAAMRRGVSWPSSRPRMGPMPTL